MTCQSTNFGQIFEQNHLIFPKFSEILANFGSNLGKFWKIDPSIYQILHFIRVIHIPRGWFCYPCWRQFPEGSCTEYPPPRVSPPCNCNPIWIEQKNVTFWSKVEICCVVGFIWSLMVEALEVELIPCLGFIRTDHIWRGKWQNPGSMKMSLFMFTALKMSNLCGIVWMVLVIYKAATFEVLTWKLVWMFMLLNLWGKMGENVRKKINNHKFQWLIF